jgi:hypothetical protein
MVELLYASPSPQIFADGGVLLLQRSASPPPRRRGSASPDRHHSRSGQRKDHERSRATKDSRYEADTQKRSQFVRSPSGSPVTPPPCTTTWRGPLLKSGVLLAELEGTVAAPDGYAPVLNWTVRSLPLNSSYSDSESTCVGPTSRLYAAYLPDQRVKLTLSQLGLAGAVRFARDNVLRWQQHGAADQAQGWFPADARSLVL